MVRLVIPRSPTASSIVCYIAPIGSNGKVNRSGKRNQEEGGKPMRRGTAGQKLIQATEAKQDALGNLAVDAQVVDDEQIGAGTIGLSTNEQGGDPVSPA